MSRNTGVGVRPMWGRRAAVVAAVALFAASCGSSKSDNGAAGTTAAAAGTTAAAAETTAAAAATTAAAAGSSAPTEVEGKVTDFAGYVGGSGAADSSKSPVKIGYFNQQGGSIEVTHTNVDGINAAVKYVNEEAGGIGGHPLEVVTCYVANTEDVGDDLRLAPEERCGLHTVDPDVLSLVGHRSSVPLGTGAGRHEAGRRPFPVDHRRVNAL